MANWFLGSVPEPGTSAGSHWAAPPRQEAGRSRHLAMGSPSRMGFRGEEKLLLL
ncbi:MAG: hypothetical protein ABIG94_04075 [Pseudomonadota bacterium]